VTVAGVNPATRTQVTQSTPVILGDVMLHTWIVRIPNGHAGQTGIALQQNGVTICPFNDAVSQFVVGNDSLLEFPIETEVGNGLVLAQYNNDLNPHTHYCQFSYTPISAVAIASAPALTVVPIA
jgi:hypothetical protein